jgi:hypothetical protein
VITLRTVENDTDIDTFVEIRQRIHPENPLPREVVVEDQIAAAKEAGLKVLRTTNDLGNAPMRRVNEKLG